MQSADNGEAELIVPTIVLAEALHVSERRNPGVTFDQILSFVSAMPAGFVAALDMRVIQETRQLSSSLELHDRIIAATARAYEARLISRDRMLSSLVETVW
jgi:predicted nucleic acid-binding protein